LPVATPSFTIVLIVPRKGPLGLGDVRWTFHPIGKSSSNPQTISKAFRVPEQSIHMEPRSTSRILHSQQLKTVLWKSFTCSFLLLYSCTN
jgi:hypothetical protein